MPNEIRTSKTSVGEPISRTAKALWECEVVPESVHLLIRIGLATGQIPIQERRKARHDFQVAHERKQRAMQLEYVPGGAKIVPAVLAGYIGCLFSAGRSKRNQYQDAINRRFGGPVADDQPAKVRRIGLPFSGNA